MLKIRSKWIKLLLLLVTMMVTGNVLSATVINIDMDAYNSMKYLNIYAEMSYGDMIRYRLNRHTEINWLKLKDGAMVIKIVRSPKNERSAPIDSVSTVFLKNEELGVD